MSFTKYDSLRDRVVLITGGASGIGEEFVKAFADNGARVAFLDLDDAAGQALAKALAGSARHAPLFLSCDVTRTDDLKAAISEARQQLGPASALINNAANDQRQVFADVTPDEFDGTMAVNFRHIYFASQAVVPQMIEQGGGSIVNMSSITWQIGAPELMGYASAKAAVVGFTHSLARQVGKHRIRVNAIAPGLVLTEKQQRLWFPTPESVAEVINNQFLPDAVMPADIANLALFLAADDSRMITRQTFSVNGGRT
ncbi:SDR family oxidoreductase [Bradyrhizobium lablabi]|uniref:SDR family NAD(P)-dependent oxidoreductase n=1 Tax=Bradyrhizobium lablabi TaxID=722472 RepID=UPI001BA4E88A|nr:SDR family oxidoreductase [Bradyrhizobium lablabi]MBR1126072.1 SDR family oxidoreductase [Bradyrhizobium lablabi]